MYRGKSSHSSMSRPSGFLLRAEMQTTEYFKTVRTRTDRVMIRDEWIERAVAAPDLEQIQEDGRIRRWARIPEAGGRYLRVVLLADGETVHNAFLDRGYRP